jgi:hypothetical protein
MLVITNINQNQYSALYVKFIYLNIIIHDCILNIEHFPSIYQVLSSMSILVSIECFVGGWGSNLRAIFAKK